MRSPACAGSTSGPRRAGTSPEPGADPSRGAIGQPRETTQNIFDGIVGVKGRVALGAPGSWYVPFYLDVGAGESKLTWQAATGISYAFKWGEVSALWRYLSYDMKSGKGLQDLSFSGPMVGATWRW